MLDPAVKPLTYCHLAPCLRARGSWVGVWGSARERERERVLCCLYREWGVGRGVERERVLCCLHREREYCVAYTERGETEERREWGWPGGAGVEEYGTRGAERRGVGWGWGVSFLPLVIT